jgi:hypothetical protein
MGRWLNKIRKTHSRELTKPTELPFVGFVSAETNAIEKNQGPQIVENMITKAIAPLPVTFKEVLASPLFDETDLNDILNGLYSIEALRLYIGSWLVNDKEHPTPLYKDYAVQLKKLGT